MTSTGLCWIESWTRRWTPIRPIAVRTTWPPCWSSSTLPRMPGAGSGRSHHYNDSRYHMLNLHATFTKGTVEFRLFQFDEPTVERRGGIHAGQLKSYIQLCLALSQMAKDVRTASPKPQQNENPKYAMRTWLLRLGFIGEEFATARDFLTRNLSGDTAFRHGRAAA